MSAIGIGDVAKNGDNVVVSGQSSFRDVPAKAARQVSGRVRSKPHDRNGVGSGPAGFGHGCSEADIVLDNDCLHILRMVSRIFAALTMASAVLPLVASNRSQPKMSHDQIQKVRQALPGMTDECIEKVWFGGLEAMPTQVDQCFEMEKPRRWRGLWLDVFEGQRFCPAPARTCKDDGKDGHIWITFPRHQRPTGTTNTGRTYVIEFFGRRTLQPAIYGHMGMSAHEIVVDKLISVAPVIE